MQRGQRKASGRLVEGAVTHRGRPALAALLVAYPDRLAHHARYNQLQDLLAPERLRNAKPASEQQSGLAAVVPEQDRRLGSTWAHLALCAAQPGLRKRRQGHDACDEHHRLTRCLRRAGAVSCLDGEGDRIVGARAWQLRDGGVDVRTDQDR